ncbi:MAG: hypothetical protein Q8O79_03290 [Pseudomonadota bacterium]|nr:hypothetical protein [Pseudomonadota bacterium]
METTSPVARLISERIDATEQLQKDIAMKAGFDKPNIITMIKQGKTRLPLDKVGPMAQALEIDPVQLLEMCLEEYQPATWKAIAPYMKSAITQDELSLLTALRASVGGPYLLALSDGAKAHLESFIASLRAPAITQ